jgi:hypothetical protein
MPPLTNPETGAPAPSAEPHRRSLARQLLPYVILVGIGAGILLFMNYQNQQKARQAAVTVTAYKLATVTRGNVGIQLRLNGVTTARDYANITAPRLRGRGMERGMNILKLAPAGSFIKQGELVAELDAQTLKDRIDDERDNLDQRENNVKKLKVQQELDMENLRQTLRVAKSELDKAELDFRTSEVRTPVDQELLKLAVEEAKARYEQLSKDVAQKEISQRADMRITEIELQIAKRSRTLHPRPRTLLHPRAHERHGRHADHQSPRRRSATDSGRRYREPRPALHEDRGRLEHAGGRHHQPGRIEPLPHRATRHGRSRCFPRRRFPRPGSLHRRPRHPVRPPAILHPECPDPCPDVTV